MLCQKCHKNLATVRYAEVVAGKVAGQQLCADCLVRQLDDSSPGFELSGPAPGSAPQPKTRLRRTAVKTPRLCKVCGMPFSKVDDTGKMGCIACYANFAEDLAPLLASLHGGTQHQGKKFHADDVRARLGTDLQTKRTLLRSALETENYEEAAKLRDEIQQLELVLGATLKRV